MKLMLRTQKKLQAKRRKMQPPLQQNLLWRTFKEEIPLTDEQIKENTGIWGENQLNCQDFRWNPQIFSSFSKYLPQRKKEDSLHNSY